MLQFLSVVAAPTAKVESMAVSLDVAAKASVGNSLSFLDLFLQADLVVKSVIFILIVASIVSWTIALDKILSFIKIRYNMRSFEKKFWSGKPLDSLFKSVTQQKEQHPLAMIFVAAMQEIEVSSGTNKRPDLLKERIAFAMRVAVNKVVDELESNIGFLATVANSAPFIGLFGTVWGIMSSFQSIAISKNTTLAVVAPGIAEALLATAIGLLAAIPAAIMYNKLTSDANKISNIAENFSIELSNLIARDVD